MEVFVYSTLRFGILMGEHMPPNVLLSYDTISGSFQCLNVVNCVQQRSRSMWGLDPFTTSWRIF